MGSGQAPVVPAVPVASPKNSCQILKFTASKAEIQSAGLCGFVGGTYPDTLNRIVQISYGEIGIHAHSRVTGVPQITFCL